VSKQKELVKTFLALKDDSDPQVQHVARISLCTMASDDAELFETVANFAEDPNPGVRFQAIHAMRRFGTKGVPILQRALADKGRGIRNNAAQSAAALGKDAMDLLPSLKALQNDPDAVFRAQVEGALHRIDPMRFAKPAARVE
jgi:HEAT repeat protein